jgi:type II secretory pathway component PulC
VRAGWFVLVALGCGPKVSTTPRAIDDDLDAREPATPAKVAEPSAELRAVAPPGKGLRRGTISRAHLVAVLDAGPATFLRQLEVAPRLAGDRFVGWQLVQLIDHGSPLHDLDLVPGDILLAINGQPLSRPEQLQAVWDSLRMANEVTALMSRGNGKLELRFAIEPPVNPPLGLPLGPPLGPPVR